jgi:long-subunit fatty acid transport protein
MSNSHGVRRAGATAALRFVFVVLATTVVPHHAAHSQDINRTVEFEDLGFTDPINVGARPAGMAGAYVASGNDVHTLVYNPAGLARIRRVELAFGVQQQRRTVEDVFYGNPNSIDTRDGGIDAAAVAYPLPAYRGGMTVAFGVYRVYSALLDLHYSGSNRTTETFDNYLLQQTGSVYSYNLGFAADLAPALSGGVALFVLTGKVGTLEQFDFTYLDSAPETSVFVTEDVSGDLSGFGGRIGVQLFPHKRFLIGVSFTTPVWGKVKGGGTAELTEHVDNAPDTFEKSTVSFENDYLLPYRFDLGLAVTMRRLLVEFDFGYSDWTQAAIDRKRFRNPVSLESTFREVFEYKVGAEYTLGRLPVRLRAGYAYLPYPLAYLQQDRIDKNDLTKVDSVTERQRLTAGLGGLIGKVLTVDASLSYTTGKRATTAMEDQRSEYRFVLGAAYRF